MIKLVIWDIWAYVECSLHLLICCEERVFRLSYWETCSYSFVNCLSNTSYSTCSATFNGISYSYVIGHNKPLPVMRLLIATNNKPWYLKDLYCPPKKDGLEKLDSTISFCRMIPDRIIIKLFQTHLRLGEIWCLINIWTTNTPFLHREV